MEMALVGGAFGLSPILLASLHLPTGFSGLRGYVERGVPFSILLSFWHKLA
jgi:hypothetical protein